MNPHITITCERGEEELTAIIDARCETDDDAFADDTFEKVGGRTRHERRWWWRRWDRRIMLRGRRRLLVHWIGRRAKLCDQICKVCPCLVAEIVIHDQVLHASKSPLPPPSARHPTSRLLPYPPCRPTKPSSKPAFGRVYRAVPLQGHGQPDGHTHRREGRYDKVFQIERIAGPDELLYVHPERRLYMSVSESCLRPAKNTASHRNYGGGEKHHPEVRYLHDSIPLQKMQFPRGERGYDTSLVVLTSRRVAFVKSFVSLLSSKLTVEKA